MREIKFRAWDERKEIMHYDFEFIRSGIGSSDWIVFKSDLYQLSSKPHPFENPHFEQQLKIMQYTGLKDKNNTDIYEGDVLDYGNGRVFYVSYVGCQFVATFNERVINTMIPIHNFEIIGNIYQHPHLLQQETQKK